MAIDTIEQWDASQERKAGEVYTVPSTSGQSHTVLNVRCTECGYILPIVLGYRGGYECVFCGAGEE